MERTSDSATNIGFDNWVGEREVGHLGSNIDSKSLPFQSWRPFKEAFSPEIVKRAIQETEGEMKHLLDPFGGSGTSALVSQFMGLPATTIEVNPFLADLIRCKVEWYDLESLISAFSEVMDRAFCDKKKYRPVLHEAPPTFVEPGVKGRYIFSHSAALEIRRLKGAIDSLADHKASRLFSVLLATTSVEKSNIVISGKGRRYRKGWESKIANGQDINQHFSSRVLSAIEDISRFSDRNFSNTKVINCDVRKSIIKVDPVDVAVFSPPYPNSFDYTDVYNIELWLLGYLQSSADNRSLRSKTLRSHVQIKRDYAFRKLKSRSFTNTLKALRSERGNLWNRDIPEMVGAYFDDMYEVLLGLAKVIRKSGRAYCIVGDSKYAEIPIPVAKILEQISRSTSLKHIHSEKFRSMRCSPQQGGREELPETLLVFERS